MTFRDAENKEIALEVLKRLRAKGLRSVRQMEKEAPVSRTTLALWQKGGYEMKGPTRQKCIDWLGEVPPDAKPITQADEMRIAAKWMDRMADVLRAAASGPGEVEKRVASAVRDALGPKTNKRNQGGS